MGLAVEKPCLAGINMSGEHHIHRMGHRIASDQCVQDIMATYPQRRVSKEESRKQLMKSSLLPKLNSYKYNLCSS